MRIDRGMGRPSGEFVVGTIGSQAGAKLGADRDGLAEPGRPSDAPAAGTIRQARATSPVRLQLTRSAADERSRRSTSGTSRPAVRAGERSAVETARASGSSMPPSSSRNSVSSSRTVTPTDTLSGGRHHQVRIEHDRGLGVRGQVGAVRQAPGARRSRSPAATLSRRVWTLPRKGVTRISGRRCRSCACPSTVRRADDGTDRKRDRRVARICQSRSPGRGSAHQRASSRRERTASTTPSGNVGIQVFQAVHGEVDPPMPEERLVQNLIRQRVPYRRFPTSRRSCTASPVVRIACSSNTSRARRGTKARKCHKRVEKRAGLNQGERRAARADA